MLKEISIVELLHNCFVLNKVKQQMQCRSMQPKEWSILSFVWLTKKKVRNERIEYCIFYSYNKINDIVFKDKKVKR